MIEAAVGVNHRAIFLAKEHFYFCFQTKWGYTKVGCAKLKKKIKNRDVTT